MPHPFQSQEIRKVFSAYPREFKNTLLEIREIILDMNKYNSKIGEITESLKWEQPSYAPTQKGVGTAIRIHCLRSKPKQFGIYFHCQTTMVLKIKKKYGKIFKYEGKRALIFYANDPIPRSELKDCFAMALTYHL